MPRFFVSPADAAGDMICLTGEQAAHAKVLRLSPGEEVVVCDGAGTDCRCEVVSLQPGLVTLQARERRPSLSEPDVKCAVYMAFAKSDKLEHVIQKATEIGAAEIVAFPSSRCVSRPDAKTLEKKRERWQKIAASAAEQSGRGCIPPVITLPSYRAALERAAAAELPLFFYENEAHLSLHDRLDGASPRTVSLMTGPEGGFSADEVQAAADAGLLVTTLGPRILRCETAPLTALSAVLYALNQL